MPAKRPARCVAGHSLFTVRIGVRLAARDAARLDGIPLLVLRHRGVIAKRALRSIGARERSRSAPTSASCSPPMPAG